jgi:hypothetical protein
VELLVLGLVLLGGSAVVALLLGRVQRASRVVGAVGGVAGCVLGLVPAVRVLLGGELLRFTAPWDVPDGSFSIALDPLSAFFPVALGRLATAYGREYLIGCLGRKRLAVPTAMLNWTGR